MGRIHRRRRLWVVLLAGMLAIPVQSLAQGDGFSDEAVERAIERGRAYLWSLYKQNEGHWPEGKPPVPGEPLDHSNVNYGGYSSLAMYALLASGAKYTEPRMKRALEWLSRIDCKGTYTLGLRMQVWSFLPPPVARPLLIKDAERLIKSISQPPPGAQPDPQKVYHYGTYSYVSAGRPSVHADHSNTQFGVLGVWAAAISNIDVPKRYWDLVYRHWMVTQNNEGGWGYGAGVSGKCKNTMTAAGLACLFVAFDNLLADKFVEVGHNPVVPPIQRGLDWFDRNYGRRGNYAMGPRHYYLYGVERVGLASGYKYFGKKDWYKLGAVGLINSQQANGSWRPAGMEGGSLGATAFSLLFLVRGRAPVIFNRLEYKGDWNNRPRALANLARWVSRTFEREAAWQIVNLQTDVEEWHDAPILMISGSKPPEFTDEHLEKLRRFVHQGGRILSVAEGEHKSTGFDRAMRDYYAKLFPRYKLERLPKDHPICSAHFKLRSPMGLWGVSNGVRLLALHTKEDLCLPWQVNACASGADAFRLGTNLFLYASDGAFGRPRGTTPWPETVSYTPLRVAKVARIKHAGNWEPEPLAWERFRMLMGQKWQTRLVVETKTLEELNAEDCRVAALTGTGRLGLTDAEKQALKAFVESGGTLIMDAAGGSEAFTQSAMELLTELFGRDSLGRLPAWSPVYRFPDFPIDSVRYRRAARLRFGNANTPRLLAVTLKGRPAALLSRDDLTAGLVGYPCYTCVGYAPESAAELMRNMVLYGIRLEKPT